MRFGPFVAACFLISVLAGCASPKEPSPAVATPVDDRLDAEGFVRERFDGVKFLEQDLAGGDSSLRLHADIYLPEQPTEADAPTKFPTILLLSPYWGGGTHGDPVGYMPYDFLVKRLLPRGYAVVFGDLGGNGGSSGCWDFMGPVERASAYAMVEAIAAQDWSDGQVGMFGLSYDGMTQVMASSDAAPHLTTVVPAAALTEAYRGIAQGGVRYGLTWHAVTEIYEESSLVGPGPTNEARRAGWIETLQRSPQCLADNAVGDDQAGAYTDYYKARDFRPLAKDVTASVFVTQGFFDANVKPDNFGDWFNQVPTEKKAWLGFWYHSYPTAQNAGRSDMYLTFHRWFDHTLYHVDNGVSDGPVFDVQDSDGYWRHEQTWPPADATTLALGAGADRVLVPADAAQEGRVLFGGIGSTAQVFGLQPRAASAVFTMAVETPLHIAGVPVFNATFAPQAPYGNVIARLYDGDRMVSQGAANGVFAADPAQAQPMVPGAPVHLTIAMYPTDWVVPAGHKLELVLDTFDADLWYDPTIGPAAFELRAGPDAQLQLPTIERAADDWFLHSCGLPLKDDVKDCFKDLDDEGVPKQN